MSGYRESASMIKLSDYIMQFIADTGVRHVFMLPGGGAMHLVDSLGRNKTLSFVCNLHEQACAIAADAYSQYTNHLGVALVTTGPGGTNTLPGWPRPGSTPRRSSFCPGRSSDRTWSKIAACDRSDSRRSTSSAW